MFMRFGSPAACAGYLLVWWGVLATVVILWTRRGGRPRTWGAARRALVLAACAMGAVGWLWINKRAEVAVLVRLNSDHGLTLGDVFGSLPLFLLVPWVAIG
jgi:hypothetical protein